MNETVATPDRRSAPDKNLEQQQQRRGWLHPQVNIVEKPEGFVLEAEMPGVGKEGLEVLLEGNELTIVGRRPAPLVGAQALYRESYDRDFRRSFELDPMIDTGKISARMDSGILYLELPKAEKVKPRKITVE
jgi:HSP20 family protein